ncbi:MAG: hypothetical protein NTX97_01720 [Bacteroidetes bacterium]|nr:hypothetical protein [Bacteroidota bacterium]
MNSDGAIIGIFAIAIIVGVMIGLIPIIFYLLTLQKTLNEVSPENRQMPPGQVWLILIPLFGMVWAFIVVNRIADSLKAEFAKRNVPVDEDRPGYSIGLTYCILYCCSIIPILGGLAAIGGLVCWIIYWVKIAGYKTKLEQTKLA